MIYFLTNLINYNSTEISTPIRRSLILLAMAFVLLFTVITHPAGITNFQPLRQTFATDLTQSIVGQLLSQNASKVEQNTADQNPWKRPVQWGVTQLGKMGKRIAHWGGKAGMSMLVFFTIDSLATAIWPLVKLLRFVRPVFLF